MAMQRLLSKFWRDCRGNAIVETALMLPLLIAILAGITEFGWSFYQASALERGLRAGATYAARADLPLSANTKTVIGNLIQTASMDAGLSTVADNWDETGAKYKIEVVDRNVGSVTVSVIQLSASVPFSPLSGALMEWIGVGEERIEVSHEQAFIGL